MEPFNEEGGITNTTNYVPSMLIYYNDLFQNHPERTVFFLQSKEPPKRRHTSMYICGFRFFSDVWMLDSRNVRVAWSAKQVEKGCQQLYVLIPIIIFCIQWQHVNFL